MVPDSRRRARCPRVAGVPNGVTAMNANNPQTDTDAERISVDFVLLPRERGDGARYRATCTDVETGVVIGCRVLPRITGVGDIVEMMGGAYRRATIDVDVQTEQLARRSRRISVLLRRRGAATPPPGAVRRISLRRSCCGRQAGTPSREYFTDTHIGSVN